MNTANAAMDTATVATRARRRSLSTPGRVTLAVLIGLALTYAALGGFLSSQLLSPLLQRHERLQQFLARSRQGIGAFLAMGDQPRYASKVHFSEENYCNARRNSCARRRIQLTSSAKILIAPARPACSWLRSACCKSASKSLTRARGSSQPYASHISRMRRACSSEV